MRLLRLCLHEVDQVEVGFVEIIVYVGVFVAIGVGGRLHAFDSAFGQGHH